MNSSVIACLPILCGAIASAQTAAVHVTHDHVGSSILPGQTMRVSARISWPDGMQWAGLKGGLLATADAGVAANVGSEILPGILTSIGNPVGGSVKGFDVAFAPAMFFGGGIPPPPSGNWWGVDMLWFDWTAPAVSGPQVIEFDFVADPIAPNVRLYPSLVSPVFVEARTTYIGTSILVLPAPGGLAAFVAATCVATRRRR